MNDGELCAWHYATREPVNLSWQGGKITRLKASKSQAPAGQWLAPVLIDVQVNGYAGIDFQQDDLSLEDMLHATRELQRAGCGQFLVTLITDEWPRLTARLHHLRELRAQSDELKSAIAGWHIEGPFLSAEPGFHGAHDPNLMIDPAPAHIRELREITGSDCLLLTLAPERAGALEAIATAISLEIKISLGHTNASAEILRQAVRAGATGFTHFGNGCPQELDRHDNILWRVFQTPGLTVSLIPDRIHVSPALFRIVHRFLDRNFIYYTTDAMAAAGAAPGQYTIGKLQVEVGSDEVVRQPGRPNFAGSALRPVDGVFRAAEMLCSTWQETWKHFCEVPARFLGFSQRLEIGHPATFCLLEMEEEHRLRALRVFVDGELKGATGSKPG